MDAVATPIDRSSTAERIADLLRTRITEGELPPGTRLSEERLGQDLQVSRNTLREAFRLLTHEGLLVHQLHRGVFVPELGETDVVDLYRLRRMLECSVLRALTSIEEPSLRTLWADVESAESAARRDDWRTVGTANMHFHEHLVALGGSGRTNKVTRRLLAEIRLAFHVASSARTLHEPYIDRNRNLLELLADGQYARAADELHQYLLDSEHTLLRAHRRSQDS